MTARDTSSETKTEERRAALQTNEGIKDTIESIVVAFILAFVFRAFLVEAFVIPTGSMAATLLGKHGTITCEDCGWEFTYGLADQSTQQVTKNTPGAVLRDTKAVCPNCRHPNDKLPLTDVESPGGDAEPGDRILVFKWPFDLDGDRIGPKRWDVAVFKDPSRPNAVPAPSVPQNFIKRLVGLPNEVLEIIDGDIYTVPDSDLSAESIATLDALRGMKYVDHTLEEIRQAGTSTYRTTQLAIEARHRLAALMGPSVTDDNISRYQLELRKKRNQYENQARPGLSALRDELDEKLHVRRKTALARQALATVVYNHDYPPRTLDDGQPRWEAAGGFDDVWDTTGRKIRCNCLGGDGGQVEFAGVVIDDFAAYNAGRADQTQTNPVSDLQLDFVLVPAEGQGHLGVTLSKYDDDFEARIWADGRIALYHRDADEQDGEGELLCAHRLDPLQPGHPIELTVQLADFRVSMDVNGTEVLATTDEQYTPDIRALRAMEANPRRRPLARGPRISAENLACELWHVVLQRDVYYSSVGNGPYTNPSLRTGWGTTGHPIWLRDGEYFMLGDNSSASKDSRLWEMPGERLLPRGEDYQLGTVPEDQLIGRAFFVYWPSGHRSDIIPVLRDWGLIPNFGRMRWIR